MKSIDKKPQYCIGQQILFSTFGWNIEYFSKTYSILNQGLGLTLSDILLMLKKLIK